MTFFCSRLEAKDFVLFTQPKTGTHLLIPILADLSNKRVYWAKEYTVVEADLHENFTEAAKADHAYFYTVDKAPWDLATMEEVWQVNCEKGTFLHLHAPYTQAMEAYLLQKGCLNVFIKRDPRDQIISLLNHYKFIRCNDEEIGQIAEDDQKLAALIKKHLKEHTIHYMNWTRSPACITLDFEKLMGAHGGFAEDEEAIDELKKMADALEMKLPREQLKILYQAHFGHGYSFFKGKVGAWREYLSEEHKTLVKEEIGDLLITLGYEQDLNW